MGTPNPSSLHPALGAHFIARDPCEYVTLAFNTHTLMHRFGPQGMMLRVQIVCLPFYTKVGSSVVVTDKVTVYSPAQTELIRHWE